MANETINDQASGTPISTDNLIYQEGATSAGINKRSTFQKIIDLVLNGITGGKIIQGGTGVSETLTLDSTSNATKGSIRLNPSGGNVGVGVSLPLFPLDVGSEKIGVDGLQVIFLPNQVTFVGSMFVGDGGTNLTSSGGATGKRNQSVGFGSLVALTEGDGNIAIGQNTLAVITTDVRNTAIGRGAGASFTGSNSVLIGYQAGSSAASSDSVFIGYQAGQNETLDNKLSIHNTNTATPLIRGDFSVPELIVNGTQRVTDGNPENVQTGITYTLVLDDAGKLVSLDNASAITLTVPPNSSVAFAIGTRISLFQKGAGQVTFSPGSGVTINNVNSHTKTQGQYGVVELLKYATDTWILSGETAA